MRSSSRVGRGVFGASGAVAAAVALVAGVAGTASAAGAGQAEPTYYVSLGDSLAAGYQPDTGGDTDTAYTDKLYAALKAKDPNLRHVKLGCSGETSATLVDGGRCDYGEYGASNQLDAALKQLRAHRGQVRYVTVTIGANDVLKCTANGIDAECFARATAQLAANSLRINAKLRLAGGHSVKYAGMRYYNPLLASWLTGPEGQATARASAPLLDTLNGVLSATYRTAGFRVAKVDRAFDSGDFTDTVSLPGIGEVPQNVGKICTLTWMCTPYRDIHTNPAGADVLADTFAAALASRVPARQG